MRTVGREKIPRPECRLVPILTERYTNFTLWGDGDIKVPTVILIGSKFFNRKSTSDSNLRWWSSSKETDLQRILGNFVVKGLSFLRVIYEHSLLNTKLYLLRKTSYTKMFLTLLPDSYPKVTLSISPFLPSQPCIMNRLEIGTFLDPVGLPSVSFRHTCPTTVTSCTVYKSHGKFILILCVVCYRILIPNGLFFSLSV